MAHPERCPHCGAVLPPPKTCPGCGRTFYRTAGGRKDALYCSPRCGAKMRMRALRKRKAQKGARNQETADDLRKPRNNPCKQ